MTRVWLPRQYGVWAMLIAPVLTGSLLAGFSWWHLVLCLTWVGAYLAFMAVRGVLLTRRPAYRRPLAVYSLVSLVGAVALLASHPALIWWAIPLALLSSGSLALTLTGRERTVANDVIAISASCLMAVVAATLPRLGPLDWPGFAQAVLTPGPWLVGAVNAAYFWGTIFYVKTMIRQRGKTSWYVASVAYHLVCLVLAWWVNPWVDMIAMLCLARAALVPWAWPSAKPKYVGFGEVALTIAVIIVVCSTLSL